MRPSVNVSCLAIVALVLLTGCEKARFDEEAHRLCKKDGGIKVYETVSLPPDRFDGYGEVRLSERRLAKPNDEFFYVWDVSYIREGNPSLSRDHFKLYRRSDEKLLAEGVGYARRGGDIPGPWNESAFLCPEASDYSIKHIAKKVFTESRVKELTK